MNSRHPDTEQLAAYLYAPNDGANAWTHSHVEGCESCKRELIRISHVLVDLKVESPGDQHGAGHLDDRELLAYIDGSATAGRRQHVQVHLDNCGACMKQLMLMRTRINEHGESVERIGLTPASAQVTADSHERPSLPDMVAGWFMRPVSLALVTVTAMVVVSVYVMLDLLSLRDHELTPVSMPADMVVNIDTAVRHGEQAGSAGPVLKVNNVVNWYKGYVETTAFGTVDMARMKNRVQAEIVAEKTARHLGYTQLVETIEGIRINSTTIYKTMLMAVDDTEFSLDGFVQGATVISRQVEWVGDVPRAMVTLRLPLFGRDGLHGIMDRQMRWNHGKALSEPATQPIMPETDDTIAGYSGVIIDARGVSYQPALYCSVMSYDDKLVFNGAAGERAGYFSDLESARNSAMAGQSPFVIRADRVNQAGELVVGQADAAIMRKTLSKNDQDGRQLLVVF